MQAWKVSELSERERLSNGVKKHFYHVYLPSGFVIEGYNCKHCQLAWARLIFPLHELNKHHILQFSSKTEMDETRIYTLAEGGERGVWNEKEWEAFILLYCILHSARAQLKFRRDSDGSGLTSEPNRIWQQWDQNVSDYDDIYCNFHQW